MTIRSRAAFSEILSKRPGPLSAQEEADLLDSLIFQGGSSSSPQTSSAASYNFAGVIYGTTYYLMVSDQI